MKEYKVYLKEVNWYRTTVTAACEEDAVAKAEEACEKETWKGGMYPVYKFMTEEQSWEYEDAEGKVLAPTKRNFHTSTVVGNA